MTNEQCLIMMYRLLLLLKKMDSRYILSVVGEFSGYLVSKEDTKHFDTFEQAIDILFFELNDLVMEVDYNE